MIENFFILCFEEFKLVVKSNNTELKWVKIESPWEASLDWENSSLSFIETVH